MEMIECIRRTRCEMSQCEADIDCLTLGVPGRIPRVIARHW